MVSVVVALRFTVGRSFGLRDPGAVIASDEAGFEVDVDEKRCMKNGDACEEVIIRADAMESKRRLKYLVGSIFSF